VPVIAEAMPEVANEWREFTIRIKPGIFFADDPAFKGLDRHTLRVRLKETRPRYVEHLCVGDLYGAVAREVIEAHGELIMQHPVGTGPFRLVEWRRASRIVLERNPNYRRALRRRARGRRRRRPGHR
jgi:ABC-type transport system substrate-binding protein